MLHILPFEERKINPGAIFIWCNSIETIQKKSIIGFSDVFNSPFIYFLATIPKIRSLIKKIYIKRVNEIVQGRSVWIHNDIELALYLNSPLKVLHLHNFYIESTIKHLSDINSKINRVISCSNALKNKLVEVGVNRNLLSVLNNGVWPSCINSNWNSRPFDFSFCGRLDDNKGFDRAYEFLDKCDSSIKILIIIANTSMLDLSYWINRYKLILLKLKFRKNIEIKSHLVHKDVLAAFQKVKILLVPTKFNEAFGMVALEGISSGCVVADSGVGGLSEVIPYSQKFINSGGYDLPITSEGIDSFPHYSYSIDYNCLEKYSWKSISTEYSRMLKNEL